ncbi:MAG: extracellular solute-binding protein [Candidatus Falkowbacteria bacterium]|nr:extracellular solute-binding protein [Candidatus Falkowbacteria bacterium]
MSKKLVALGLLFTFIITSGFGCKTVSTQTKKAMEPITLEYWRVFDDSDSFQEIIDSYKVLHPNITINYHKYRIEEYETELINALAEDRGPDMFTIHNTWTKKYENKIIPLPAQISMAYQVEKTGIQKEVVPEMRTTNSLTPSDVRSLFVDVVASDAISNNQIFGLPLSVDTLSLFYNKDLFNSAGIANPPEFWDQVFQQDVKKLTKQDTKRQIIQSGVSLGVSKNINRFSDILMVLMMQNGSKIIDGGKVIFNEVPENLSGSGYNPGLGALVFFTDFSNPIKEVYSWNDALPNSLEMFMSGNLAMTFGYSYDLPTIRARAPKMNFAVVKVPQIAGNPEINFANYWLETVSKKSKHPNEAWDFVQYATKKEQAKLYLAKTKKPTALRSLIDEQKSDAELAPFVSQVLTAKSWYHGANPLAAETAIGDMITNAAKNYEQLKEVLDFGANQVQQTIQ